MPLDLYRFEDINVGDTYNDVEATTIRDAFIGYELNFDALYNYLDVVAAALEGIDADIQEIEGNIDFPKTNFVAVSNPTLSDDVTDEYSVGSEWVNTVTKQAYRCVDATTNAAVWKEITRTPGSYLFLFQNYR